MYPVSEITNPNATLNPTFDLAYWRFGLDIANKWKGRQGKVVPGHWMMVHDNLAPLPMVNETYPIYEGIQDMWINDATIFDASNTMHLLDLPAVFSSDHVSYSILLWRV